MISRIDISMTGTLVESGQGSTTAAVFVRYVSSIGMSLPTWRDLQRHSSRQRSYERGLIWLMCIALDILLLVITFTFSRFVFNRTNGQPSRPASARSLSPPRLNLVLTHGTLSFLPLSTTETYAGNDNRSAMKEFVNW